MWFVLFQVQYWVKPVSGFGIVFTRDWSLHTGGCGGRVLGRSIGLLKLCLTVLHIAVSIIKCLEKFPWVEAGLCSFSFLYTGN